MDDTQHRAVCILRDILLSIRSESRGFKGGDSAEIRADSRKAGKTASKKRE